MTTTTLTPRQATVLRLAADGCDWNETAARLGISRAAVRTALERARRKLDAQSTVHAVALYTARQREQILTGRQLDALRLAAAGLTTTQIGRRLGVVNEVVCKHLKAARDRLGARTTAQAVAIAVHRGLINQQEVCGEQAKAA